MGRRCKFEDTTLIKIELVFYISKGENLDVVSSLIANLTWKQHQWTIWVLTLVMAVTKQLTDELAKSNVRHYIQLLITN